MFDISISGLLRYEIFVVYWKKILHGNYFATMCCHLASVFMYVSMWVLCLSVSICVCVCLCSGMSKKINKIFGTAELGCPKWNPRSNFTFLVAPGPPAAQSGLVCKTQEKTEWSVLSHSQRQKSLFGGACNFCPLLDFW